MDTFEAFTSKLESNYGMQTIVVSSTSSLGIIDIFSMPRRAILIVGRWSISQCELIDLCIDKNNVLTKSFVSMLKAFLSKDLALKFNAVKETPWKPAFKTTSLFHCMDGTYSIPDPFGYFLAFVDLF